MSHWEDSLIDKHHHKCIALNRGHIFYDGINRYMVMVQTISYILGSALPKDKAYLIYIDVQLL